MTLRPATSDDISALRLLMDRAISNLMNDVLTPEQVQASFDIMGMDTQLIADGTYFVVELDGEIAGCGGWSRRATLFGGDQTEGRNAALLDPNHEAARASGPCIQIPTSCAEGSGE